MSIRVSNHASGTLPAPSPAVKPAGETRQETCPLWMVVLYDDDLHTYEYVVTMLVKLFRMSGAQAFAHACEVDSDGTTVVACLPRDEALKKRDEIMSYGGDPLLGTNVSMKATAEPLEG